MGFILENVLARANMVFICYFLSLCGGILPNFVLVQVPRHLRIECLPVEINSTKDGDRENEKIIYCV